MSGLWGSKHALSSTSHEFKLLYAIDMSELLPILYSFRRCPYAMRARMALSVAGVVYEHREILLRDKPKHMVEVSPKGTVPVLVVGDNIIDESLDIMLWSLAANDPNNWLEPENETLDDILELIALADDDFKESLDKYKYSSRHGEGVGDGAREKAMKFLKILDQRLENSKFLFGENISLADIAIFPFVRQFAGVDREWFDAQDHVPLLRWLVGFENSELFKNIMQKHPLWQSENG